MPDSVEEQQKMALLDLKGKLNNGEQTEYPKKLEQIFWNERELQVDASDNVVHYSVERSRFLRRPYIALRKGKKAALPRHHQTIRPRRLPHRSDLPLLQHHGKFLRNVPVPPRRPGRCEDHRVQ